MLTSKECIDCILFMTLVYGAGIHPISYGRPIKTSFQVDKEINEDKLSQSAGK